MRSAAATGRQRAERRLSVASAPVRYAAQCSPKREIDAFAPARLARRLVVFRIGVIAAQS